MLCTLCGKNMPALAERLYFPELSIPGLSGCDVPRPNRAMQLRNSWRVYRPAPGDRPQAGDYNFHRWTAPGCWITNAARRAHMGPAKIYFIIFGILTIAGGIVGYVKAGSLPSIIAGSITGVLLLIAGSLLPEHRTAGLATGLVISLLLAAQFIPKFLRTGKAMPAGMMSILSVIGIIMAIVAWVKK
jgi:uncharacterized membrane protein (UPF0136 family)